MMKRNLCINRNNHQKPTFHPLGDFLNPALALLGQGLFKAVKQIAKKEKVKRMLTHVISGANISLTDRFFRKIGATISCSCDKVCTKVLMPCASKPSSLLIRILTLRPLYKYSAI
jgi:hypothetical protein